MADKLTIVWDKTPAKKGLLSSCFGCGCSAVLILLIAGVITAIIYQR